MRILSRVYLVSRNNSLSSLIMSHSTAMSLSSESILAWLFSVGACAHNIRPLGFNMSIEWGCFHAYFSVQNLNYALFSM